MLQPQLPGSNDAVPLLQDSLPRTSRDSDLPLIQELLKDPKFSVTEILRLISLEIVRVIQMIEEQRIRPSKRFKLSFCSTEIRILRALAASAQLAYRYRDKEDVLDLDGPKFDFVYDKILACFEEVLRKTLGPNSQALAKNIMLQYKDLMVEQEADIRRELKKMG